MAKNKTYEIDMTSGPLFGKILLFSIPLMLSGMLQLLFNAADIIVVGRFVGESALAAVGSTGALINLITNLFIGLSVGTNVIAARAIGSDNKRLAHETVHTSVIFSVLSGIALAAIGIAVAKPVLLLMGTPDDVIDQAVTYMRVYFAGMPMCMLYNFGYAVMRAIGDTRRPMYYLIFSGIINVFLNIFFVTQIQLGVAGVALATIISQAISALLIIRCLCRLDGMCRLDLRKLRFHKNVLLQMVAIGIPAGLQGMVFSISNVLIQSSINSFGKSAIAGNTASSNIETFAYMAMNAIHQTTLSFTSQNYGAAKLDRVMRIFWICLGIVTAIGIVMGNTMFLFCRPLLSLYNDSPSVIEYGALRMKYLCIPYFLCGTMEVIVGSIRGLGSNGTPMFISLAGACGLRVLWIYTIFAAHPDLGTLYLNYPITWGITTLAQFVAFFVRYKKVSGKTFFKKKVVI